MAVCEGKVQFMQKAKISDVAREAGVSISTASKALNGTGAISPDTIKRVEQAAKRLGYSPNRAAQLLAGKNKSIGVILPDDPPEVMEPLHAGILEAMEEYAPFGFRCTLKRLNYMLDFETGADHFSEAFLGMKEQINGLIFVPPVFVRGGKRGIRDILPASMPKISLQIASDESFCRSVTIDENMVGRMAAEFLSLTGSVHNAAVIAGNTAASIHRMNVDSFSSEASARGIRMIGVRESFDDMKKAYEVTKSLIESDPELDGIFVSSYVSPAVCDAVLDAGKSGRIKIIGVDVFDRSAECLKKGVLSAIIYQNQKRQAKRSVVELTRLMREGTAESVHIKPELVLQSNLSFYI